MADTENAAEAPATTSTKKMQRMKSSRAALRSRMIKRQKKKKAAAAQANQDTTSPPSETAAVTPTAATEPVPMKDTPTNSTEHVAINNTSSNNDTAATTTQPKEPENVWDKPKKKTTPVHPQQPTSNGRANLPELAIPTGTKQRPPPTQRRNGGGSPTQRPTDREQLFRGKAPPPRPNVERPAPRAQNTRRTIGIQERLKRRKDLMGVRMDDDYQQPDHSQRSRLPPRSAESSQSQSVRPSVRPKSSGNERRVRPSRNGDAPPTGRPIRSRDGRGPPTMRNGSTSSDVIARPEQRRKTTRQTRQPPTRRTKSSTPSESTTGSSRSKSSRSSGRPSSSGGLSATTDGSGSSSPIRRVKKNLRNGLRVVEEKKGKRVIRKSVASQGLSTSSKQQAVWLNGSLSDPATTPTNSTLNPEAEMFQTTAILTETGGFLNDDYYRLQNAVQPFQTQIPPVAVQQPQPTQTQAPAQPQPVTPTELDFSHAANNFPSYQQPTQQFHDMFGAADSGYYANYPYQVYPDGAGAYYANGTGYPAQAAAAAVTQYASAPGGGAAAPTSGAAYAFQNGMASGATSGSTSVSGGTHDYTQMLPPTHMPNPSNGGATHTATTVTVVNGAVQPQTNESSELVGASTTVPTTAVNGNDTSMTDYLYENGGSGYYASNSAM